jgi:hypothetical protein
MSEKSAACALATTLVSPASEIWICAPPSIVCDAG